MPENKNESIHIIKSSGAVVPFNESKLKASLIRVGAEKEQAENIISQIKKTIYEGISTRSIYRIAFKLLRKKSRHLAARYNLKKGIMQLGPAGYAFEKYISELLINKGFKVKLQQFMQGRCVAHEIDVVAENEKETILIECKYHNQSGFLCDIKIPLYIHSRYNDVLAKRNELLLLHNKIFKGWVVTNTKFTKDAIKYALCSDLTLIGWDYPETGSLKQMIDSSGLYPITCLTSLTTGEKQKLLSVNIVLCKELIDKKNNLNELSISSDRIEIITKECINLCTPPNE